MFPRLEEEHPLTRLEGINLYDRSRFMEEGIENVENLAHHNLIELMLSTRISTNRLVDLFDQAILYIHLGLEPDAILQTRKQLLDYGIRTATDLEAARQSAKQRANGDLEKLLNLLNEPDAEPAALSRLQTILDTLQDDDWMTYLRNWRELSQRDAKTYTLRGTVLEPLDADVEQAIIRATYR
jgi:hypothetical protein